MIIMQKIDELAVADFPVTDLNSIHELIVNHLTR